MLTACFWEVLNRPESCFVNVREAASVIFRIVDVDYGGGGGWYRAREENEGVYHM